MKLEDPTTSLALPTSVSIGQQIVLANNRIVRGHRRGLDNEYAEGVRDALSWVIGKAMVPFNDQEDIKHE